MNDGFYEDLQIAKAHDRSIIIEGIPEEPYRELIASVGEAKKRDFLKLLSLPRDGLREELNEKDYLFLWNVDFIAKDVDPEKATEVMHSLRHYWQHEGMSQLMLARPGANLNYNEIPKYRMPYHHPLGTNWCGFYEFENGRLKRRFGPLEHPEQLEI